MQVDAKEEWIDKVIELKRVTKVVKGGKRLKISASIVVGNGNGIVGIAHAKASEVIPAVNKAREKAKKNIVKVVAGRTIPHEVSAKFSATRVLLKPASPGTGIIACASVRSVLECAGYRDVLTKSFGSRNPYNLAVATIKALSQLRSIDQVAKDRGKPISYFIEKKKEDIGDAREDNKENIEGIHKEENRGESKEESIFNESQNINHKEESSKDHEEDNHQSQSEVSTESFSEEGGEKGSEEASRGGEEGSREGTGEENRGTEGEGSDKGEDDKG